MAPTTATVGESNGNGMSKGISTPKEEGRGGAAVLTALDDAPVSLFHFKTIAIAGMGFFTDAYDLFSIGLLTKLIGRIYYGGHMPVNITAAITSVALCGTFTGQLLFGYLGDKFGRKSVYGLTLWLMIVSSIGSALSFGRTPKAVVSSLCFWRFLLGLGIGGDYPLSATIMSEYSNIKNRGAFVAAVFAMQGTGILVAAAVTLIVAHCFEQYTPQSPMNADYVWRIVLGFSAIPTAATLYLRNKMPETARYTLLVAENAAKASKDMSETLGYTVVAEEVHTEKRDMKAFLKVYGRQLFGCAACWFLLDVAFYSQGLYQSDVFKTIGWVPSINVFWPRTDLQFQNPMIVMKNVCNTASFIYTNGDVNPGLAKCTESLHNSLSSACHNKSAGCWMSPLYETFLIARAQAIIALFSTIPGYWMTVLTIDRVGRKPVQTGGFFMMTLSMAILAGAYPQLLQHIGAFVFLYSCTFFFANWGPNATTFVIPAEAFPSKWRCSAHGFCAACGKLGAIVGAYGFLYASKDPSNPTDRADYGNVGIGLQDALWLLAASNALGLIVNIFFVKETMGRSLEDIGNDGVGQRSPVKALPV